VCAASAGVALTFAFSVGGSAAEMGLASWYGKPFHGQTAASGEAYDAEAFTAAHRTLPFGTSVRVRRVDRGDSVVVRINDRGPYSQNRIIDVSEAAARRLGMTAPGVVKVAVEVMADATPDRDALREAVPHTEFVVQAGSFRNPDNARRMRLALANTYGTARIIVRPKAPGLLCVVVGDGLKEDEAEALAARIRAARKGNAGAYVIRLDLASVQSTD